MPRNEPIGLDGLEPSYAPQQLAAEHQLSVKTILRLFAGEPGVLMFRANVAKEDKTRPRYTMRIPHSVAARVFRRLRVRGGAAA